MAICMILLCLPVHSILEANSAADAINTDTYYSDNPFNKQDDKKVAYNGSAWIQPVEWNMPRIDLRGYEGYPMLFFDQIGLELQSRGKTQRVYFSMHSVDVPVNIMKFHIFYDTRLTVKPNGNGEYVTVGRAIQDFSNGSAMIEEGQLAFYALSDNGVSGDGCLFTIDFIIPENAEKGDIYPIGIEYRDDGIVYDMFLNNERDMDGKTQMAYVFQKGIYNGFLSIMGEKETTTTTTTTMTTATTTVTAPPEIRFGDINLDGKINPVDASLILIKFAELSAPEAEPPSDEIVMRYDINDDGLITAVDASLLLAYCADLAEDETLTLEDFLDHKAK